MSDTDSLLESSQAYEFLFRSTADGIMVMDKSKSHPAYQSGSSRNAECNG